METGLFGAVGNVSQLQGSPSLSPSPWSLIDVSCPKGASAKEATQEECSPIVNPASFSCVYSRGAWKRPREEALGVLGDNWASTCLLGEEDTLEEHPSIMALLRLSLFSFSYWVPSFLLLSKCTHRSGFKGSQCIYFKLIRDIIMFI